MALSEHDEGYVLGLQAALNEIECQKNVSHSMAETKREKDAIWKVCEILRVKISTTMVAAVGRGKRPKDD